MRDGLLNDIKMHVDEYRVTGGLEFLLWGVLDVTGERIGDGVEYVRLHYIAMREKVDAVDSSGYLRRATFASTLLLSYCS
jgi:hypothetical protein